MEELLLEDLQVFKVRKVGWGQSRSLSSLALLPPALFLSIYLQAIYCVYYNKLVSAPGIMPT